MNCSNVSKKLCGNKDCITCYNRSFATNIKSQYWSYKNDIEPYEVFKSSNKKYLFTCPDCNHELLLPLCIITLGQWCKYCNSSGLCLVEDCGFCYKKSFASHPMASSWSVKNKLTPRDVVRKSEKKYLFNCSDCNHEFQTNLYSIFNDKHCPYCINQKLCESQDCIYCFNKSCASHKMNDAWATINILKSHNVFLQSNKKIIFNCLTCNHEYETTPNHYYNRNGSCPYCANKKLCNNNCDTCFNKTFAAHPLISSWSNKNTINPRNVFKGSEIKCIFNCNTCYFEFESKLYNVLTGYWCPYCKKKTEAKLLEFIKNTYNNYKTQSRFNWCRYSKTQNIMPFDFELVDKKILIELDGNQHFIQVSNWDSPESVQTKDIEKINYCFVNNYSLIHIYQEEIWNNKYDWKDVLAKCISYLEKKSEPIIMFISCCNKYTSHIQQLNNNIKYLIVNPFRLDL
jgi:very-short-patch-repair endonuclease